MITVRRRKMIDRMQKKKYDIKGRGKEIKEEIYN